MVNFAKRISKKKKVSTSFDSEKVVEDEVDLGLDVDSQEVLWQNLLNYRTHIHLSLSNDL